MEDNGNENGAGRLLKEEQGKDDVEKEGKEGGREAEIAVLENEGRETNGQAEGRGGRRRERSCLG